mgnify:CR=1 FL=1
MPHVTPKFTFVLNRHIATTYITVIKKVFLLLHLENAFPTFLKFVTMQIFLSPLAPPSKNRHFLSFKILHINCMCTSLNLRYVAKCPVKKVARSNLGKLRLNGDLRLRVPARPDPIHRTARGFTKRVVRGIEGPHIVYSPWHSSRR